MLDPGFMRLLNRLAFQVQGRVRGGRRGERRSTQRGAGGQFVDVRPYTIGDDLRHLDWHLFARLDTLLVRLYEAQQEHTVHVALDTSASMGVDKGLFCKQLAASLAYLSLISSDRVGLFAMTEQIDARLGPLRGKNAAGKVFKYLEGLTYDGQTDLEQALRQFSGARHRGTALIISDFLVPEGRTEALKALASSGMRVAVLHVLSPAERNPAVGQDLTLVDSETGQEMVITIDRRVRQAYMAQVAALEAELKETCRKYGFAFVPVDSGQPLDKLILGDLRRHGLVAG
mgnify:CR=1 FL=1